MTHFLFSAAVILAGADLSADSRAIVDQIAAASERTNERLEKEGAAWTTAFTLNGARFEVLVQQFPDVARFQFFAVAGGRLLRGADIISRDGFWYVAEDGRKRRYREFEAPLKVPFTVFLLHHAALQSFTKARADDILTVEPEGDGRVVIRCLLPASMRANLERGLKNADILVGQLRTAGIEPDAKTIQQNAVVRDILKKGTRLTFDMKDGVLIERGVPTKQVAVRDFRWLGSKPDANLIVVSAEWDDHATPIPADRRGDLVQIGYSGIWSAGSQTRDTDLQLLDVSTGAVRRVPFPHGCALSGCFSRDRTRVFVPGSNFDDATLQLFEIDLANGTTSAVGGDVLSQGMWLGPCLSPDEKTLAASQILVNGLKSQIYLIDLKTRTPRPLGEPMDAAFLNWRPDGKGLIYRIREDTGPNKEQIRAHLCSIDLEGVITRLRPGDSPIVLPGSDRILFEDSERLWKTCSLTGEKTELFGDGFRGYGSPTAASDGTRLMMMRFRPPQAPEPCIIDLKTHAVKTLTLGPGLWIRPAW